MLTVQAGGDMSMPRGTVVLALIGSLSAAPAAAASGGLAEKVRAWRRAHQAAILREFADFLALPNLASDGESIRRNAAHIVGMLERRGVRARLLEAGGGPPAVYGELLAPGAERTILVYAHYDGQPVDPARWTSPPWTPVLLDRSRPERGREIALADAAALGDEGWLYARSASDDKAPVLGWLVALDALRAQGRRPSVNLKFLFEGEEEAGSDHMEALLAAHGELLRSDLFVLCDGPVHPSRRMQLYFGARGVTGVEITVYGPARALHSGHYGNWAPNPGVLLAHLVASLRDADGRILVPGFYDDVRPLTPAEKEALARAPDVDAELRDELALATSEAGGARLAERIMLPALNLRGLESGRVGAAAANAIPSEARASIDFRLVPDQTPGKVRDRFEAHLRALGWHLVSAPPDAATRRAHPRVAKLEWAMGYPSSRTALDLPIARVLAQVIEQTTGQPPVQVPTLGGSVPMHLFSGMLKVPVVGVPIANHDNNQHAADENIRLRNLWDGIEVYAGLLDRLGQVWLPVRPAPRR
jgi:acetylornithine deacetylase/succinyl-diaminopimelate desuccinylase-like protein